MSSELVSLLVATGESEAAVTDLLPFVDLILYKEEAEVLVISGRNVPDILL